MPRPNIKIQSARARYNKKLGKAVSERRQSLGITLPDLALRSNTTKSSLFYIEAGEKCPSVHLLDRIAKELGTTVNDLLS